MCLLCCKVDFSELSLHLNSTDLNRVPFYTTGPKKIRNLSSFSKLGSYLICLYTTGPENDLDFFQNITTCDKTWIFQYDPETKRQSMH